MNRPRVLLADDHRIVVDGLTLLLEDQFDLVGIAGDGREMIAAAKALDPDVIVSDIGMPRLNGIDAFVQLRKEMPKVKVVFLTMHSEIAYARRALDAGAMGFVPKHAASTELITAIRAALNNKVYIAPAIAGELLQAMQFGQEVSKEPGASLTPRQRQILQYLAEGQTAKNIAKALNISQRTVEFHKYQMMESLNMHNNTELLLFAVKHHLVVV